MGRQDEPPAGRRLHLRRETLRDLAPSAADAAAVRGGDSSTCGLREFCLPMERTIQSLLGQTSISWGCTGSIKMIPSEEGFEIVFDLHPNQELLDAQEKILRKG